MESPRQYRDFDLALERQGGSYRATVRSPAGEAEVEVSPPRDLASPMLAAQARQVGQELFGAFFHGPVLDRFAASLEGCRKAGEGVRIRLLLDAVPELTGLPWESLFDPDLGRFLVQSEGVLLARFMNEPPAPPPLSVAGPLRLLAVMPQPVDQSPAVGEMQADAIWQVFETALAGPVEEGRLTVDRLLPASQRALEKELERTPTHLLFFLGQGEFRQRARYGRLIFEGSGGRARAVSAELVGKLLERHDSLRLAVLSARGTAAGDPFLGLARDLVRGELSVAVSLPANGAVFLASGLRALFAAVAGGEAVDVAVAAAARLLVDHEGPWAAPALFTSAPASKIFSRGPAAEPTAAAAPATQTPMPVAPVTPVVSPTEARAPTRTAAPSPKSAAQRALEEKTERGDFDIFLSYNSDDSRAVKEIANRLKEAGVLPWLDEWELRPGYSWQRLLGEQIGRIRSAAVFVGDDGLGPWQRREMEALLNEFVERRCPVIPVLLPSAPARPVLPIFLKGLTWVDFRRRDPDPLSRLIWGITGSKSGLG